MRNSYAASKDTPWQAHGSRNMYASLITEDNLRAAAPHGRSLEGSSSWEGRRPSLGHRANSAIDGEGHGYETWCGRRDNETEANLGAATNEALPALGHHSSEGAGGEAGHLRACE